jgi:nicotinate-nucleotide adenylyltransferase
MTSLGLPADFPYRPGVRIGLFGGSFDPLHLGHLILAQDALEELALDWVVFIPAARNPLKSAGPRLSDAQRLAILETGVGRRDRMSVCHDEISRPGPSYAIDTVQTFLEHFPSAHLAWLIGEDSIQTLPEWKDIDTLAEWVTFASYPRPDQAGEDRRIRERYAIRTLQGHPVAISSSQIRERLSQGLPVDLFLPAGVTPADLQTRTNDELLTP